MFISMPKQKHQKKVSPTKKSTQKAQTKSPKTKPLTNISFEDSSSSVSDYKFLVNAI